MRVGAPEGVDVKSNKASSSAYKGVQVNGNAHAGVNINVTKILFSLRGDQILEDCFQTTTHGTTHTSPLLGGLCLHMSTKLTRSCNHLMLTMCWLCLEALLATLLMTSKRYYEVLYMQDIT